MRNKGFTLLELLITVVITSMAGAVVTYFVVDLSNFGVNIHDRVEGERDLERTLRVMLSEIRSMGPAANGAYDIAVANPTTFQFYSDIDGDGIFEQVRYFLSGTTLKKGVTKPTGSPATYPAGSEVVADAIFNLVPGTIFQYYGTGLPSETGPLRSPFDISLIRLIQITGTVDKDPAKPPLPVTLSIMATIRNLRGDI